MCVRLMLVLYAKTAGRKEKFFPVCVCFTFGKRVGRQIKQTSPPYYPLMLLPRICFVCKKFKSKYLFYTNVIRLMQ